VRRLFVMNLWGVNVTEKTETRVDVPDDRDLLITRLSLGPGAPKNVPTFVYLINHDIDEKYVLGTLRAEGVEQFEVDVNIAAESSISLNVSGPGTVHFVGYYNRLPEDGYSGYSDSLSDFDSDDSDSEGDAGLNAKIAAYMGGSDSSSGEDYEDAGDVEELSETDSDIDVEENSAKSPVKQKQTQQIQPKPQVQQHIQTKPQAKPQTKPQAKPQAKPQQTQATQPTVGDQPKKKKKQK